MRDLNGLRSIPSPFDQEAAMDPYTDHYSSNYIKRFACTLKLGTLDELVFVSRYLQERWKTNLSQLWFIHLNKIGKLKAIAIALRHSNANAIIKTNIYLRVKFTLAEYIHTSNYSDLITVAIIKTKFNRQAGQGIF